MPWIDSHCHLDAAEFDADRDAVLARARAVGGPIDIEGVNTQGISVAMLLCQPTHSVE